MKDPVASVALLVFTLLAAWHFYMAIRPARGETAAVPSVGGKPLFIPSTTSTIAVGVVLLLFAGLVAATAGFLAVGIPTTALAWMSYLLATGLLLRAVGEFRYVGFFKRVKGSRFATMDTWFYSPLCLALAAAVWYTGSRSH